MDQIEGEELMEYVPPRMFIGSSSEALKKKIPHTFRQYLSEYVDAVIWDSLPEFDIENTTMDALFTAANEYDFALLILTPDDIVRSRGKQQAAPRDNVLLEWGLFLGAIGPDRTFVALEKTEKSVKVPSDIGTGAKAHRFSNANKAVLDSSIGKACLKIGRKIEDEDRRQIELKLASNWGCEDDAKSFYIRVGAVRLERYKGIIGRRELAMVARLRDHEFEDEDDERIVITKPRRMPRNPSSDFLFKVNVLDMLKKHQRRSLDGADVLEGHIILLPQGGDPRDCNSISEMIAGGCHKSDTITFKPGDKKATKKTTAGRRKAVKKPGARRPDAKKHVARR